VVWLPFDLHPEYPPDGLPRARLLARYGPRMTDHVRSFFASRGLDYNPNPEVVPNSMRALQLTELARDLGRHAAVHDRLMDAYWSEGQNIGDADVLRGLATELALPAEDVEEVLAGERYRDRIEGSTRQAASIGANAVPAFLLDRRLLVLGAQPEALFEQAFEQLQESA
jgi:predicted DsbA family dithiol-disulfide isomerase